MQSEADTQPCSGCGSAYPGKMVLTAHAKVSARLNHCENDLKIGLRQCRSCQMHFRHEDELNTCLIRVPGTLEEIPKPKDESFPERKKTKEQYPVVSNVVYDVMWNRVWQ